MSITIEGREIQDMQSEYIEKLKAENERLMSACLCIFNVEELGGDLRDMLDVCMDIVSEALTDTGGKG